MEVILEKDIKSLGSRGDIVRVKDGYARNYLIPRGLAVLADNKNRSILKDQKRAHENKKEKEIEVAENTARKIDGLNITLKVKAGENDKLFGSVTSKDIADEIARAKKVRVDKRKIILLEPIKNLGEYRVDVKIHENITTSLNVIVTKQ